MKRLISFLFIVALILSGYVALVVGIGIVDAMAMNATHEEILTCVLKSRQNWERLFPSNQIACWLLEDIK